MKTKTTRINNTTPTCVQAVVYETKVVFLGIDAAKRLQTVARFVPGEGVRPAETMSAATLLKQVARPVADGVRVYAVYEAGSTGLILTGK